MNLVVGPKQAEMEDLKYSPSNNEWEEIDRNQLLLR